MRANDLIRQFSERLVLPIDVNHVAQALNENGVEADIEFIGVDLDPDILMGQIKIFHTRDGVYGDPKRCANIYYDRGQPADWQRLVCCKELFHLVDPESAKTSNPSAIDALAEKIGLPPEMQDPLSDGFAANIDRLAEYRAAAILLPLAARNALLVPYQAQQITAADIARLADMPRKYVAFVMSDGWPAVHNMLIS